MDMHVCWVAIRSEIMSKKIKLEAKGLYKVFGPNPKKVLPLIERGDSKSQIFAETEHTLGVNQVSLEVYKGEIFVIMGLSGSGKSTLVRLFNRLIEPTLGEVYIDGESITQMSQKALRAVRRKKISMVFQSFALMPHLTVLDNTAFGLILDGVDKETAIRKAQAALEQVGLATQGDLFPAALSGGMQQRVGIARALATGSELMLMDEAFSALDPIIRSEMQDELLKLQQKSRHTIIFISHDLDEAMRIGDRIAIMQDGDVIQVDTPEAILKHPANDYVASFFKGVSVGKVLKAGYLARPPACLLTDVDQQASETVINEFNRSSEAFGVCVDSTDSFQGIISQASVATTSQSPLSASYLQSVEPLSAGELVNDILEKVAKSDCPLPVVDQQQRFCGVISQADLLMALGNT